MNKNVVILNFSPRKNGNCGQICEYLINFYNRTNVRLYSVNLEPCGDCDYECLNPGEVCPSVSKRQKEIMDEVCSCDVAYYVVPNFCGWPCANYFAFNERTVGYFNMDRMLMDRYMKVQKRFIVVSNSENDSFRETMRQQTNEEPVILYMKTGKYHKRSINGDILNSDEAVADLKAFLEQNG